MPTTADPATRAAVDATIRALRTRIAQARARVGAVNEENTKRVLITPLLEALGWDVLDLDEVQNEYRTKPQDNPVDYAMFLRRSPCLFFEAKSLGQSLADRRWVGQNIGYASVAGVHWCVLTNGDEYRLYNAHAPVDADEKLFRTVCLADEGAHARTVDTLLLLSKAQMQDKQIDALWAAHFIDRRVRTALTELLAGDDSLVRLIAKRAPGLSMTDVRQALARADVRVAFPTEPQPSQTPARAHSSAVPSSPAPIGLAPVPVLQRRGGAGTSSRTAAAPLRSPPASPSPGAVGFRDILAAGLVAAPLKLHASHKGRTLDATVLPDGSVEFGGRRYASPSMAGAAAVERPTCNGWIFWRFRDSAGGEAKLIDELRSRFRARPTRRPSDRTP